MLVLAAQDTSRWPEPPGTFWAGLRANDLTLHPLSLLLLALPTVHEVSHDCHSWLGEPLGHALLRP